MLKNTVAFSNSEGKWVCIENDAIIFKYHGLFGYDNNLAAFKQIITDPSLRWRHLC